MKSVLIIGMGRFGTHIAQELYNIGHEVMAIDVNETRINNVMNIVTNAQIGDASDISLLKSIGVRNFDVCIVTVAENFQTSLEVTYQLKELGANYIVSRAANESQRKFLLRNGADEVVYPEKQLASWAAIRYTADHIHDYIQLPGEYSIYEVDIPDKWLGHTIGSLDIRRKYNVNILAVKANGKLNPEITPDTVFRDGETILVLGSEKMLKKWFHL
ncbi:MAG: TrkA family potassium uptake protein [Ruminococcus sp.]|nr:TrkA family potassium uptake protein [Ruminococcus sp.]